MKKHVNHRRHHETVSEHAKGLLAATAHVSDDKIAEARKRLNGALETAHDFYENVEENVVAGAKKADTFIRRKPYQASGLALGIGALLGLWFARRK